jgi:peptidoglycan/LPS O-acetylase OafA/YrhL
MSWSYRPALDGLRSIAVYLVLLFHTGMSAVGGGFIGVDLFFVLSGFLVSNVILSEIDRTGTLRIGHFYARRVRRLLPAALLVVVATSLVFVLVAPVTRRMPLVGDAQSALLYVANWRFLHQAEDYFATNVEESPFLHFWSLAIEEQFYVVFPVLLLVLARVGRRRGWVMPAVLGGLLVASLGAQLYWAQVDANHAYYGTDARLYQLLAGAVLTVVLRTWRVHLRRRAAETLALGGLAGLLVLGSGLLDLAPSWRGIGATAVSVALLAGLSLREDGALGRVLSQGVPVYLGRVSYGTYLWHWPVILVLQEALATSPRVIAVLAMAIATGLAAVSYELLEMPVRRTALLDRFRWNTAVAGVAVSALVAVTVVPWTLEKDRAPVLTAAAASPVGAVAAAAQQASEPVPANVNWKAVGDDVGSFTSCAPTSVEECRVVEGDGPHVLVVGDSHAQMLTPMFEKIAEEHDLTLSLNIRPGCPWQEDLTNPKASDDSQELCELERVGWFDEALPAMKPDVVVLVARARDDERTWGDLVGSRSGRDGSLEQITLAASRDTLQKVQQHARAVVVESMVMPETFQPLDCLASGGDPSRCAVAITGETTPSDAFFITEAATSPKLDVVDLNPAFCPHAPVCQPVVDGDVVWRDDHHLTAAYATSRRDEVWRLLRGTGAFDRG